MTRQRPYHLFHGNVSVDKNLLISKSGEKNVKQQILSVPVRRLNGVILAAPGLVGRGGLRGVGENGRARGDDKWDWIEKELSDHWFYKLLHLSSKTCCQPCPKLMNLE
jgi:hypothetical protein